MNYYSTLPLQSYYSSIYVPSINYSAVQSAGSATPLASCFLPDVIASHLSTVLLLLKDTPWHLCIQEHPHHQIINLVLKPSYNLWWFLILDYPFVISLRLFDNSCCSGGKRMECLKAVLANKTLQLNVFSV